jgi:hypothetical protein
MGFTGLMGLSQNFFPSKSTVCGGGHDNEAGRQRKKKEVGRGERNDEFF